MKKRKRSIFEYILFPLLAVIIVQGIFSLFTFQYTGTTKILYQNSVELLNQTSDNRKNQLENLMVSRWSNVGEQVQKLEENLKEFMAQTGITMEEFLINSDYQRSFLIQVSPVIIRGIRNNNVTGAFLILSNDRTYEIGEREGVYFRDPDPDKNPNDYTDLSLVKGRAEIGKEYQIPLEPLWEGKFRFTDLEREQSVYYYNPITLAKDNLDADYSQLGYWSEPFYLNENSGIDSYEQITYSVPLIYEGKIYGVFGTELEMGYFCEKLPIKEIDSGKCGSYALVIHNEKDEVNVLAESGNLVSMSGLPKDKLKISDSQFNGLKFIDNTDLYGAISPLKIYHQNSPFANKQIALMTITTEEKLFGIGNDLLQRFVIVTLSSLLFGVICIYFVAKKATRPIRFMAEYLRNSKGGALRRFQETGAKEIEELFDVICNLNERQLEIEAELKIEKERYIAALESSSNVIFEYSVAEDIFWQYAFKKNQEGESLVEKKEYKFVRESVKKTDVIEKKDQKKLDEFFRGMEMNGSIFICLKEKEGDKWLEIGGKIIHDECHRPQKIIGSIRNVTEETLKKKESELEKTHDSITGLLNLSTGKRKLLECENEGNEYQMIFVDIDHFSQINDNNGTVFGNMILEVVGNFIHVNLQDRDLAIRCGGDQILVALRDRTLEEAKQFCADLLNHLEELCLRSQTDISISIGAALYRVGSIEFQEIMQRLSESLQCTKNRLDKKNPVIAYEEMTEEEKNGVHSGSFEFKEIMGMNYEKNMSLSSIAFNLFDRAKDVSSVISFLLGKIARDFKCSDVIISMVDNDFYANRICYQWHSKIENIPEINVHKYSEKTFKEIVGQTEKDKFILNNINLDFFFGEKDKSCICFPMFENHAFIGAITFAKESESEKWEGNELDNLHGVVNIIRTNIIKNNLDIASKAKSEFLSRMSHEIRTPMNAIIGMCNIALQQKEVSPRVEDCLEKISSSSEYLLTLINDILDMSKIESGKLVLEHSPFQCDEFVNGVEMLIRPQAEQKKITFDIVKAGLDTYLLGDSLRLNQIMINLLGNALKFTPEGGKIEFITEKAWEEGEQIGIRFTIKDNGIGISKEQEERIFRAFEQAEEGTARTYGGTGLGLSICKNLVQMMGGKLKLNSELGMGSEFSFVISFSKTIPPTKKKEQGSKTSKKRYNYTGKRVLLVEDIELNVEIVKNILELSCFQVEVASNGKIATEMFETVEPGYYDVILMDVRMPVMDGLEATKVIRKMNKADASTVPIIAMTANAFDEDMKKSIESGMNGHLTKPIDMDKFYSMLNNILGKGAE